MKPAVRTVFALAGILTIGGFALAARQRTTPAQPQAGTAADATKRIVAAAQAVIASLDDAGKNKVLFPADSPQKTRWSNFPSGDLGEVEVEPQSTLVGVVALTRDAERRAEAWLKAQRQPRI